MKLFPVPKSLQQKLALPGKLYRVDTYGDGSCFAHSVCRNLNLKHGGGKSCGLLLREVLAQFCLPRPPVKRLKTMLLLLEESLSRRLTGLRRWFNKVVRGCVGAPTVWDAIWSRLGSPPTVPSAHEAYRALHVPVRKLRGALPWFDVFHITYASALMMLNIVFINSSPECYRECVEGAACVRKCKEPGLYCGVENYAEGNMTMLVNWWENRHFEAIVLKKPSGELKSMFPYGGEEAKRIMAILRSCDISPQERLTEGEAWQ